MAGKRNNRSNDDNKTKNNGFIKDNRNSESHPKNSLMPSTVASKGVPKLKM